MATLSNLYMYYQNGIDYSRVVSRLLTKATVANLRRREDAAAVAAVAAGGMHALAEFSFLP